MKILVVDDEVLVRRSLTRVLKSRGHDVTEAVDGAEGLTLWKSLDPDLVFLDVLMPGLSGPQVLEELGSPRRAKVVMMSAYSGDNDSSGNKLPQVDLFLAKPFDDIFEVVQKAESLK